MREGRYRSGARLIQYVGIDPNPPSTGCISRRDESFGKEMPQPSTFARAVPASATMTAASLRRTRGWRGCAIAHEIGQAHENIIKRPSGEMKY